MERDKINEILADPNAISSIIDECLNTDMLERAGEEVNRQGQMEDLVRIGKAEAHTRKGRSIASNMSREDREQLKSRAMRSLNQDRLNRLFESFSVIEIYATRKHRVKALHPDSLDDMMCYVIPSVASETLNETCEIKCIRIYYNNSVRKNKIIHRMLDPSVKIGGDIYFVKFLGEEMEDIEYQDLEIYNFSKFF